MATTRTRTGAKVVEVEVHQDGNGGGNGIEVENGAGNDDIQEIPNIEKPKKVTRKKSTPKKRGPPKPAAPKPKEVREFMQNQAEINASILEQLRQLNQKDKCGQTNNARGSGGQAGIPLAENKGRKRGRGTVDKRVCDDTETSSQSDSDDSQSDGESVVRRDISEANALLQARFTKTTGKHKSAKRIERDIRSGRPFAFLDREVQRQLVKDNCHPEELTLIHHVEGLVGMVSARCADPKLKGMINHVHQILIDCQVHYWPKIRKWSNETLVKTATQEWEWLDNDNITQARNSNYMIQSLQDTEDMIPCPAFNRGQCASENSHFSTLGMLAHVCAFCYALEGIKDHHQAKSCGKRRSSSNYFRHKDEGGQQNRKEKIKYKNFSRENVEDRGSKN